MKQLLLAAALCAAALAAGIAWQDAHYRLDVPGLPGDQVVTAHRDSVYTGVTWVKSDSQNFYQLRFFDKVEGGVCLRPSWADLAAMPELKHLDPGGARRTAIADPGTLNSSAYISFFPAGLLLNRNGADARTKPWNVLIVGLGSGVGLAQLAHHFPQVSTTVVDIDQAVIDIVRQQYPLMDWLGSQTHADGRPRVRFAAADARQFIRSEGAAGKRYDLIILDAYTAGSTIPPHLMTREFFAECGSALADGGVLMANVIGSYGTLEAPYHGEKRLVVGGALRSMRAAGFDHGWVVPVIQLDAPSSFDRTQARNMMLFFAKHAVGPGDAPAAWERLRAWTPFPELTTGVHLGRQYFLTDDRSAVSTYAPAERIESAMPLLRTALAPVQMAPDAPGWQRGWFTTDADLVRQAAAAGAGMAQDQGWRPDPRLKALRKREIDCVAMPREVFRVSIGFAQRKDLHDPELLVGPLEGPERPKLGTWAIPDAPLFTDQTPNADILNL